MGGETNKQTKTNKNKNQRSKVVSAAVENDGADLEELDELWS